MADVIPISVPELQLCFFCTVVDGLKTCPSCSRLFCITHKSEFDSSLCTECVSQANATTTSAPLVDDEDVTRKGRHITLTGEAWLRSRDVIERMTDLELEAKLTALKTAVHEAEQVLDYRRIIYAQAYNEKDTRLSKKLMRRSLIKGVSQIHTTSVKVGIKGPSINANMSDALKALKKMGLTPDAVATLLQKLGAPKKK